MRSEFIVCVEYLQSVAQFVARVQIRDGTFPAVTLQPMVSLKRHIVIVRSTACDWFNKGHSIVSLLHNRSQFIAKMQKMNDCFVDSQ